jgi:hypothetical protein
MTWRASIAALYFLVSGESALAFCSKPNAPYCASQYDKFDDQDDFDSCKSEMESYQSDVELFMSCLRRQGDEAISEYNDAVASFDRRAQGY